MSRLAARAALALALACGCAPARLATEALPGEPIAISYLEPEAARQRQRGALEERERRGAISHAPGRNEGAPALDAIGRYVERALGAAGAREADADSPRLALLDPRSGRVSVVEQALRGSRPLDWSPDRSRLLFAQLVGGAPQLFELVIASGEVRQLTRQPGVHPGGCYGSGGSVIAAVIAPGADGIRQTLGTLPAAGGPIAPLSEGPRDERPSCSPDGTAVAFARVDERGRSWIALAEPIDAPVRLLGAGSSPRFSRDGAQIVFSAPAKRVFSAGQFHEQWQLWRVRRNGSGRVPLGLGALDELDPSFSPDGRWVAYVGVDAALGRALYLRRADGSGDRLLFDDGDALTPVW